MTPPLGQTPRFCGQNALDSKQVTGGIFRGLGLFVNALE